MLLYIMNSCRYNNVNVAYMCVPSAGKQTHVRGNVESSQKHVEPGDSSVLKNRTCQETSGTSLASMFQSGRFCTYCSTHQ